MCHKCQYGMIDGVPVHINGDVSKMDDKTLAALRKLVKLAKNYALMKQIENNIMKKQINRTGQNGVFRGEINVIMNYKTETREVHNHILHEEVKKAFTLHKITGTINGKHWKTIDEIDSESMLENEIEKFEKDFISHLEFIANEPPRKTFTERMNERGFY